MKPGSILWEIFPWLSLSSVCKSPPWGWTPSPSKRILCLKICIPGRWKWMMQGLQYLSLSPYFHHCKTNIFLPSPVYLQELITNLLILWTHLHHQAFPKFKKPLVSPSSELPSSSRSSSRRGDHYHDLLLQFHWIQINPSSTLLFCNNFHAPFPCKRECSFHGFVWSSAEHHLVGSLWFQTHHHNQTHCRAPHAFWSCPSSHHRLLLDSDRWLLPPKPCK